MGLFDQFPYTNFHELNLDWLLRMMKELNNTVENFVALNTIKYADPIQWNITTQYEANTVVVDPQTGTAYISSKAVPSGVALTNTDYWSIIFTLDVISANKNITLRDDGSNVLATFPSAAGDWLLWNGTLYKVSQAINTNEAYVAGYNLDRYTVELFIKEYITDLSTAINNTIGALTDLTTSDKTSIVNAINELAAIDNIKWYNTVQDMITDTALTAGSVVYCSGYHTIGDGGDGCWYTSDAANAYHGETCVNTMAYPILSKEINVLQYGAYGDDTHDDTAAIQAAIDDSHRNTSHTYMVYIPGRIYKVTNLTLDIGWLYIYGDSSTKFDIADSNEAAFIDIINTGTPGGVANLNYNFTLRNLYFLCNSNNATQSIIRCICDSTNWGLWHAIFENLRIEALTGTQKGIYFRAVDSESGNINVANQYLEFHNVTINRMADGATCFHSYGQIGQTIFDTCELNSFNQSAGYNVIFEPDTSFNDTPYMPATFINCTFQSSTNGVYGANAMFNFIGCHFEGITTNCIFMKNGFINFEGSNIAGSTQPILLDTYAVVTGTCKWTAPSGTFIHTQNIGSNGFDTTLLKIEGTGYISYYSNDDPWYNYDNSNSGTLYCYKTAVLNRDANLDFINAIQANVQNGDSVKIINLSPTYYVRLVNRAFNNTGNLYWDSSEIGSTVIDLAQYDSIEFTKTSSGYILTNLQRA